MMLNCKPSGFNSQTNNAEPTSAMEAGVGILFGVYCIDNTNYVWPVLEIKKNVIHKILN